MKKIRFFKVLPLVMAAALSFGLVACKNTADDDSSPVVSGGNAGSGAGQSGTTPGAVGELPDIVLKCSELAKTMNQNDVVLFYYKDGESYTSKTVYNWTTSGDTNKTVNFDVDSSSNIAYANFTSAKSSLTSEMQSAIDSGTDFKFIIKPKTSWDGQTPDTVFPLISGKKVMYYNGNVYVIRENMKCILSASAETATTIKAQLSVSYGLALSASANGFTFAAADGTSISVSDVVNYDAKNDRSKNKATNLLITLSSPIDATKESWTLKHEIFGEKAVATTGILASALSDYTYSGDDLGLTLNGTNATFKIWAPTASSVKLRLYASVNDIGTYSSEAVAKKVAGATTDETLKGTPINGYPKPMDRGEKGVWSLANVDVSGAKYYKYEITVRDKTYYVCDINAKCASPDSIAAQIVDINSNTNAVVTGTRDTAWGTQNGYYNPFGGTKYNDAVIYEMHIRDWSRAVNSTSTGKFTELADDEIINHLKDLGITHVQILPMFDYAQVNADENYNWGYNPYHYNVPEGRYVDYSANPDGTAAVAQMRTMISKLHDAGIAVIMDVVYNHTSGTGTGSLYDSTVPYYYYRMKSDGSYSNGSGCGNETNSAAPMFKKYMIDSLKHWMLDYHINGFRFDLMGLHEQETMKEIYDTLKQIDQKVMVYGEPWTGGTSLVNNSATVVVASGDSGYGAFEDGFRNTVKGSEFGGFEVGQVQGVNSDAAIINGLKCVNTGHNKTGITGLSIHYVECHDNFTLYDKLVYSLNLSETQAADRNGNIATKWNAALAKLNLTTVKKQDKLAAAYVLLSQGTPFINGGQDFLRTKKGNPDSYAADKKGGITWTNGSGVYNIDDVNTIDLSFKNTGKYDDVYNTYKGLIALRKSSTAFTSPISCTAENIGGNNDGVVKYTCTGADGTYVVYFNGSDKLYASGSYGVSGTEIKVASGAVVVGETIDSTTSLSLAPTSFQIIKLN